MPTRVPRLKEDATNLQLVRAYNDLREGWVSWALEQNKRDKASAERSEDIEDTLNEIAKTLREHAAAAKEAVEGLGKRVDQLEALPTKALRWIIVTVGGGLAVNLVTNYFLHQYTGEKIDNAAAQAQRAAAVSTVSAAVVEHKVDNLSNAIVGPQPVPQIGTP